jgi:hypothetical protein
MSAYVVSDTHIDAMLTVIAHGPVNSERDAQQWRDAMRWANVLPDANSEPKPEQLTRIGAMLLRENIASVEARYPQDKGKLGDAAAYLYHVADRPNVVEAFKLIDCYEYQACEHDGWKTSAAAALCNKLRGNLISSLPGWDAAPWGWNKRRGPLAV